MSRRYSPDYVAKLFGVTKGTVIGWCKDGTMPAVNVARVSSTRERWRMSEEDIATFEARRQNAQKATRGTTNVSGRLILRPTKDYFAKTTDAGK
jgi:hypothetical protein